MNKDKLNDSKLDKVSGGTELDENGDPVDILVFPSTYVYLIRTCKMCEQTYKEENVEYRKLFSAMRNHVSLEHPGLDIDRPEQYFDKSTDIQYHRL